MVKRFKTITRSIDGPTGPDKECLGTLADAVKLPGRAIWLAYAVESSASESFNSCSAPKGNTVAFNEQ
jgi:hypothetical protein